MPMADVPVRVQIMRPCTTPDGAQLMTGKFYLLRLEQAVAVKDHVTLDSIPEVQDGAVIDEITALFAPDTVG